MASLKSSKVTRYLNRLQKQKKAKSLSAEVSEKVKYNINKSIHNFERRAKDKESLSHEKASETHLTI